MRRLLSYISKKEQARATLASIEVCAELSTMVVSFAIGRCALYTFRGKCFFSALSTHLDGDHMLSYRQMAFDGFEAFMGGYLIVYTDGHLDAYRV